METAVPLQFRRSLLKESLSGTSFSTSIAADIRLKRINHRRLRSPGNVREPPMRYLIQNRINAYPLKIRQPRVFSAVNSLKNNMADEAKKKNSSSVESAVKQKESEILTSRNIPPPPEKPLPGDCCGSGCVRCVWDVYYEELEEYNKLDKSSPDSAKPPS